MGAILLDEQTAPGTPSTGQVVLYPKSDGFLYSKDDAGTETQLATTSVASATTDTEGIVELATQAEMDAGTASKVPTTDLQKITLGTPVAISGSPTSVDFTGIPAGVRRITMNLVGISTNGTSIPILQIGDSGGIEPTGYLGSAQVSTTSVLFTTGFGLTGSSAAASIAHGRATFELVDESTNTWTCNVVTGYSNASGIGTGGGSKSLSATLDRVRLTTVNGTDAFDAGTVNITYER